MAKLDDYASRLERAGADALAQHMKATIHGGKCYLCDRPYKTIETGGPMYAGVYHAPTCSCLPRCPFCGNDMAELFLIGELTKRPGCTICGFPLILDGTQNWKLTHKEASEQLQERWARRREQRELEQPHGRRRS